ncbi:hypothetical protein F5148DRAFT_1380339 [Russula earlei]|uniref:Uncharacterized protein n=1 Tax=Russula earlei TaxID=71964 RepID=A0ACC0TTP0_9AGAM|nr:hypothetical protein F5148DRAFT_1380339 [Russula earlei]
MRTSTILAISCLAIGVAPSFTASSSQAPTTSSNPRYSPPLPDGQEVEIPQHLKNWIIRKHRRQLRLKYDRSTDEEERARMLQKYGGKSWW